MPFERRWVPEAGAQFLEVHEDLPKGFKEDDFSRAARGFLTASNDKGEKMYYCPGRKPKEGVANAILRLLPGCGGWIAGEVEMNREDSMSILSGRRGIVYNCRRCGKELHFFGSVS